MTKRRQVLLVPHGKKGATLENVVHNLDLVSVLISTFLAATIRKHPDIKDEMVAMLQEILAMSDLSLKGRAAVTDALAVISDLPAKEESAG